MDVPYSHYRNGLGRFYLGLARTDSERPVDRAVLHGTVDSQPCVLTLDRTALSLRVEGMTPTDIPRVGSVLRNLCLDSDAALKPIIATPRCLSLWQNMPPEKRDSTTVAPRGPWRVSRLDDTLAATLPLNMSAYDDESYTHSVHRFLSDLPPEFGLAPTVALDRGDAVRERHLTLVDYQETFLKYLNRQQRYVLIHRYGLRGNKRRKRQEIADALGVGYARVADIEHIASRRMHHLAGGIQRSYAQEISDE